MSERDCVKKVIIIKVVIERKESSTKVNYDEILRPGECKI